MNKTVEISEAQIDQLLQTINKDAEAGGYHVNTDPEFTRELVKSLLVNEHRYGYQACPCRLASGNKDEDGDIICPCDYRDSDLNEHGSCFCALYVSEAVLKGTKALTSIPEQRSRIHQVRAESQTKKQLPNMGSLSVPVWRCKVCGYLCARQAPPEACPICKVGQDRFERFL